MMGGAGRQGVQPVGVWAEDACVEHKPPHSQVRSNVSTLYV